ncbi:hypothetical protein HQ590_06850 [bacterium]|nr:hypothetical protein [bacterium]
MNRGMALGLGAVLAAAVVAVPTRGWPADPPSPAPPAAPPSVTAAYRQRLVQVRQQIPAIITAAEAVAQRWVDRRHVLLHFPFGGDTGNFSMEMISRAGGLDNAQPNTVRVKLRSTNDVVVVGPRSWEKGARFLTNQLAQARSNGWLIVVFGSRAGMPADLPVDYLIDNGATTGAESKAALNIIVNITQAWVWSCELTAALTRLGWHPAILKGMPLPGSQAHNHEYQRSDGLPELYKCDTAIPAGELAGRYLDQVERQLTELEGRTTQQAIGRAADIAVDHLQRGKTIWAASNTHVLDGEVFVDNHSPIKAFRGISCGKNGETFTKNLQPGDLLFFFGEWTMNLPWRDYLAIIRSTRTDYIPSWRVFTEPTEPYERGTETFYDQQVNDALMVLDQRWPLENAAVAIPFPPGKMAPVSGVHVCLLYRLLDEAIARRLAGAGQADALGL